MMYRTVRLMTMVSPFVVLLLLTCRASGKDVKFGHAIVIDDSTDGPYSVCAADLDGDSDQDLLVAFWDAETISWFENSDGAGNFGSAKTIASNVGKASDAIAVDIDSDGDMDVISASNETGKIAWYENLSVAGEFSEEHVITSDAEGVYSIYAADLDGDGDKDVLSASWSDAKIAWYENIDGEGEFGLQRVITDSATGGHSVIAADLDGDEDLDVAYAASEINQIAWCANIDGKGTFGTPTVLSSSAKHAFSVFASDLDNDADIDLLSTSSLDNKIAWFENTDGAGSFSQQRIISEFALGAVDAIAVDIDDDGNLDVLSASNISNTIEWFENASGKGDFNPPQLISDRAVYIMYLCAADFDGDGDIDVVSTSRMKDMIVWYRNSGLHLR